MDDDLTEPSFPFLLRLYRLSLCLGDVTTVNLRTKERERDKAKVTAVMVPVMIVSFYSYERCN